MAKWNRCGAMLYTTACIATMLCTPSRGTASSQIRPHAYPAQEIATAEPLPDLTGFAWEECRTPGTKLKVANIGASASSAFVVRSPGDAFELRLDGLAAGATVRVAILGLRGPIQVDADNEVRESDEDNNVVVVVLPGCRWFIPVAFSAPRGAGVHVR